MPGPNAVPECLSLQRARATLARHQVRLRHLRGPRPRWDLGEPSLRRGPILLFAGFG